MGENDVVYKNCRLVGTYKALDHGMAYGCFMIIYDDAGTPISKTDVEELSTVDFNERIKHNE